MSALGQNQTSDDVRITSALPPKADIAERDRHVDAVRRKVRRTTAPGRPKHALGRVQYLRTIGYNAWIEDTNGNEIDEKALKMAIRSPHEDAHSS